ncbi:MAG: hypothetical protein Q4G08_04225 [Capnocytophaga sp.]|nr:hypothetical protein [Capnocytophaga sp.]
MDKLTIINKRVSETAQTTINGNTVTLSYEYENDSRPLQVHFQVMCGKEGDENYTGTQVMGGSYDQNGTFSSYVLREKEKGGGAIADAVYEVCRKIVNGEAEQKV